MEAQISSCDQVSELTTLSGVQPCEAKVILCIDLEAKNESNVPKEPLTLDTDGDQPDEIQICENKQATEFNHEAMLALFNKESEDNAEELNN